MLLKQPCGDINRSFGTQGGFGEKKKTTESPLVVDIMINKSKNLGALLGHMAL